jgi:hypothetical protein
MNASPSMIALCLLLVAFLLRPQPRLRRQISQKKTRKCGEIRNRERRKKFLTPTNEGTIKRKEALFSISTPSRASSQSHIKRKKAAENEQEVRFLFVLCFAIRVHARDAVKNQRLLNSKNTLKKIPLNK